MVSITNGCGSFLLDWVASYPEHGQVQMRWSQHLVGLIE